MLSNCEVRRLAVGVLISLTAPGTAAARQARISGTVVDRFTQSPIGAVAVEVEPGTIQLRTDSTGRFALPTLPTGKYVITFSHASYRLRVDTLIVTQPGSLDGRVPLDPIPVELDSLAVAASASPLLTQVGFYTRKSEGLAGRFIERSEIDRRDPRLFTDLFHSMAGVNMRTRSIGNELIRFKRTTGLSSRGSDPDGCLPDLYLDGILIGGSPGKPNLRSHNVVDPASIEGVEVYVGASTPIKYKSACGVILVWTRRGG